MKAHPSKFWTGLFKRFCNDDLFEELQGDLEEAFQNNTTKKGIKKAQSIYRNEILRLLRFSTMKKSNRFKTVSHLTLLNLHTKLTYRNISRNKLYSFINIIGLAASITVGLFWVNIFYTVSQFDKFHENSDSIYRITTHEIIQEKDHRFASSPKALASMLKEEMPYSKQVTQVQRFFELHSINKEPVSTYGLYADDSFFDVFSFKMIEGDSKAILSEPNSIILTKKAVEKFFPNENPINKVFGDSKELIVKGVMENPPMKSHLHFEVLVSKASLGSNISYASKEDWKIEPVFTYVLKDNKVQKAAISKWLDEKSIEINALLDNTGSKLSFELQPITSIMLVREKIYHEYAIRTMPLSLLLIMLTIVSVIMAIAIFNYTNLSIARAIRRSKEVGIRKIVGSTRKQIAYQFLTESVIFSFIALLIGVFLYKAAMPLFIHFTKETWMIFDPQLSIGLIVAFVIFTFIIGLLSGVFPALYFSKVKALQAVQNTNPKKVFSFIGLRKIISTSQLTFSLIFILSASIFGSMHHHLMTADLGFKTDGTLVVESFGNNANILSNEFEKLPEVESIGRSSFIPGRGSIDKLRVKNLNDIDSINAGSISADKSFMGMYQIKVIYGRNFLKEDIEATTKSILINTNLAKSLGFINPEDALEQILKTSYGSMRVVGIIQDFSLESLTEKTPNLLIRHEHNTPSLKSLSLKIRPDNTFATIAALKKTWQKVDQKKKFNAEFLDVLVRQRYQDLGVLFKMINFLTIIIVAISSLGQLGIALFNAESRLQEISIRKILGARTGELMLKLSKGFIISILIAISIASPICYWFFNNNVLSLMAPEFKIGIKEIGGGILLLTLTTFIIVSSQTWRVIRVNPSESLRNE